MAGDKRMTNFSPAEALLLNTCLAWGIAVVTLAALIALWVRRNQK